MKKKIYRIISAAISGLFFCVGLQSLSFAQEAKVINHSNWSPVACTQNELDVIRSKKMYFGHASIGGQILDGIRDLSKNESARYSLRVTVEPSALNDPGLIDYYIGPNGDPLAKVERFKNFIQSTDANGHEWGNTLDIAYFKFCYVDFDENSNIDNIFDTYITTVNSIITQYPNCKFVYFTVPLQGNLTTDRRMAENVVRNEMNAKIRDYVQKNGGILFDLADIESYDDQGNYQSFSYNGKTYPKAWFVADNYANDGWTTDDGAHLNDKGKDHLARAMWNLWVAITSGSSPVESLNSEGQFVKEYAISDNYPNPFNPATTFEVDLPRSADVSLEVFNVLGDHVSTQNENHLSPGVHHLTWAGNEMPSGIYFYKINIHDQNSRGYKTKSGRMILIK